MARETRLLLVTIAVSIGVLLLLSRFRFPAQAAEPLATPTAAPLERLAARAAYEELASTMADLERRLQGSVVVLPVLPARSSGAFVVAPRVTADRAVALLHPGETLPGDAPGTSRVIATDPVRELTIATVPPDPAAVVTPRAGPPRPGPRYLVAVEGSVDGLTLRPVYVGKTALLQDGRTGTPLLVFAGLQHGLPRGAALFSLDGIFIGLVVTDSGTTARAIPGDVLRTAADAATPLPATGQARLGVEVDVLTDSLARATAAAAGVIVTRVESHGPANGVLFPGDVISAVDGTPVTSVESLLALEQSRTVGKPLPVEIVRKGRTITVPLTPHARGTSTPDDPGIIGRSTAGGIEVIGAAAPGAAHAAGLRKGDVIVTVDGRPAPDVSDLAKAFRTAPVGTAWVLIVERGGQARALALEK